MTAFEKSLKCPSASSVPENQTHMPLGASEVSLTIHETHADF